MHRKKINPFKITTILLIYIVCHTEIPDLSYATYPKFKPSSMTHIQTVHLPSSSSLHHASCNFNSAFPHLLFEPINLLLLKNWIFTDVYAYMPQTSDLHNNILYSLKDKKRLSTSHHNPNKSSSFHNQGQPASITTFIKTSTVSVHPGQKSVMVYKEKNAEPESRTINSYNLPYSRKIDTQTLSPIFEIESINGDLETTNLQNSLQIADEIAGETIAASLPHIHHMKNFNQAKKNEIEVDDLPKPETYYEAILRLFHNNEGFDFD